MKAKHPDILNLIDDKLEQKIRNVKIRTSWDVMSDWKHINYKQKIEYLMERYHLSLKRIESIIKEED